MNCSQFGGKCQLDKRWHNINHEGSCILNKTDKDSTGNVISFNDIQGYVGKYGCCSVDDGMGGTLPPPIGCIGKNVESAAPVSVSNGNGSLLGSPSSNSVPIIKSSGSSSKTNWILIVVIILLILLSIFALNKIKR